MKDRLIYPILSGLLIYLSCLTNEVRAQTENDSDELNELTVDRPGIAESPFTVAPGTFQFETGFDYYSRHNGDVSYLPVMLFRTGLSKSAELRITERHLIDKTGEKPMQGFSPLNVGVKVHIIKQAGWIPETDILTNIVIPLGDSYLQPDGLGHEILLLFQHDITKNTAVNYNIGYLWDGREDRPVMTGSLCFNYLPTQRLGFFLEYYLFSASWPGEHGMDGGMTYLLTHHLQLDLSGGISMQEGHPNYFVSTGFSVRFQRKPKG